jgi:uncharacterized membrane protein
MEMSEIITEIRWANVFLTAVILVWMLVRWIKRHNDWGNSLKLFWITLMFYVLGSSVTAIEGIFQHLSYGSRSAVFIVANICMLTALALTRHPEKIDN